MRGHPNVPRVARRRPLEVAVAMLCAAVVTALPMAPSRAETPMPVARAEVPMPVARAETPTPARTSEAIPGRYVVVYEDRVDGPAAATQALERAQGFHARFTYGAAVKGFAASLAPGQAKALRRDPRVALVAPDRPVQATASVPLASGELAPTGVRRMRSATTSTTREASSVNVAVIDTGVDLDHPDLNVEHGKNCSGTGLADDNHGHGTHVAGTIGAENDGAGVVGVAPGTQLFAVKVLDASGRGTMSSVICGIDWVTSTRTDASETNDIAVANMSLAGSGDPVESCGRTEDPEHLAICRSTAAGVSYVAAAGNSAWDFDFPSLPDVPAAYPQVLTVTALSDGDGLPGGIKKPTCEARTADDKYASFSNFAATAQGASHTIAAPGQCIYSTTRHGGHGVMSGTSMAAPHVAGAVALCLDEAGEDGPCSGMTPAQIIDEMRAIAAARPSVYGFTGDPAHPVRNKYFGYLVWAGLAADVDPPPPVHSQTAEVIEVLRGTLSAGGVDDLAAPDRSYLKVESSRQGRSIWYGSFPQVSNSLRSLEIAYLGKNSSACTQRVSLYHWDLSAWVHFDTRSVGSKRDLIAHAIGGENAAYVSGSSGPGELRMRVRCKASVPFVAKGDLMNISYDTP